MEDVGVPRSRVPELLDAIERDQRGGRACRVGVFGHAGDGNLHPTFVVDRDDPDAEATHQRRAGAHLRGRPGARRHDHRRARHRRRQARLPRGRSAGPEAVRVMRAIKAALDPLGILNPGKVL